MRPILITSAKAAAFALRPCFQSPQRVHQLLRGQPVGHVDRRGDHVVGGLAAVDVIVGVHGLFGPQRRAQQLVGPVGDHLVGVHVPRGAAAGLKDVDRKVLVPAPLLHLSGRLCDGLGQLWGEGAQLGVDLGRGALDRAQRPDQGRRNALVRDAKILHSALCLRAPVGPGGKDHLAHGVRFCAKSFCLFTHGFSLVSVLAILCSRDFQPTIVGPRLGSTRKTRYGKRGYDPALLAYCLDSIQPTASKMPTSTG